MASDIVLRAYEPLFATPLMRFEIPDAARLDGGNRSHARRVPGLSRGSMNGWHSEAAFFHRKEGGRFAPRSLPAPETHFIVGIENSAPSFVPLGQREVTVFVFV